MRDNDSMIICTTCKEAKDWCTCTVCEAFFPRPGSNPLPTFLKPTPLPNPPAPKRTYPYFDHNGIMYDDPAKRDK